MLKSFVEKIAEMAENKVHTIGADAYTDKPVYRVEAPHYTPKAIELSSLDSVIDFIANEINKIEELPLFINIISPKEIEVIGTYDERYRRKRLYVVHADTPINSINMFEYKDDVIIQLRSVYQHTEDIDYLLNLLSVITDESAVKEADNGITQTVTAKKGIAINQNVTIKPKVLLRPYRTFIEVEQPASEFILRMNENKEVLIKEADGGAWRIEAKRNIADYLTNKIKEYNLFNVIVTA